MRAESFVLKVGNVTTGSHVLKGQPLMDIYSPAVSSAAAEYLATISSRTTAADGSYGRGSKQRLIISTCRKSRLQQSKRPATFRPPSNGRRREGPQLSRPRVSGQVEVIYPEINKEARTARIRVELANPDLALRHDMYVDAQIETGSGNPVLTVPESAVMDTGSRQAVFVDKGQGRFEPREVKLGHRGSGYVEVRQGVAHGVPVVVSANFLIDAESNLKAALKGFTEGARQ